MNSYSVVLQNRTLPKYNNKASLLIKLLLVILTLKFDYLNYCLSILKGPE